MTAGVFRDTIIAESKLLWLLGNLHFMYCVHDLKSFKGFKSLSDQKRSAPFEISYASICIFNRLKKKEEVSEFDRIQVCFLFFLVCLHITSSFKNRSRWLFFVGKKIFRGWSHGKELRVWWCQIREIENLGRLVRS